MTEPEPGEAALRHAVVAHARQMNQLGLNGGTSGNVSARCNTTMLITPSATPYETMTADDVAAMPLDGPPGQWRGPLKPSTEWPFHRAILRARPADNAVIHTHSTFCTVLAIGRRAIPPCHYMVAAFGGRDVRCAPYARFGSEQLAEHALEALHGRNACLLANHGMIAVGPTLERALWLAAELETLARQYYFSSAGGAAPVLLDDREIAEALDSFVSYGRR